MPFWQFYQKSADWLDWPALLVQPSISAHRKWPEMVVSASTNQVWTKFTIGSYAHIFCHSESDTSGVWNQISVLKNFSAHNSGGSSKGIMWTPLNYSLWPDSYKRENAWMNQHMYFRKFHSAEFRVLSQSKIMLKIFKNSLFPSSTINFKLLKRNLSISLLTIGILLPKLFWPTVRKKCSSDQEKLLKFEAEAKNLQKFWDH